MDGHRHPYFLWKVFYNVFSKIKREMKRILNGYLQEDIKR